MKKVILSIAASAAIAIVTLGQAPQGFKYQAVVRDASNTILTDQAVGFQLIIQEGSIGGTAVYTETFTPTSNDYGIINIEIGTGTTVDDFSAIDWANNSYFLETSIDVSGGSSYVVMGTSQFKSVPYALHSKTVENDIDEQILSYDNVSGELTISNGNTITLPMTTGGDNWGAQAAATDATLSGDGTSASPLSVQGDLTDDQNLTGATLTGTSLQIDIDNGTSTTVDLAPLQDGVDDADADPTNELQNWSNLPGIPGDFSDGVDNVDDADADPTNELQNWSNLPGIPGDFSDGLDNVDDADNDPTNEIETWGTLAGIPADLQDGDDNTQLNEAEVDAFVANNGYITSPDDADADPINEIQDLQLLGNILTITNNGTATSIDLSAYLDNTDTQLNEAQVDAFVANNGYLTTEVDGSITNEIQDLQLLGNILTITNNGTATSIDLSAYLDNTDTQLNEAQVDAFVANNGYITSPDDADADPTNEIQDLQLLGNILTITNNGTATSIDLSAYLDNTDTQLNEAQVDAFVANNGYLTTEVDGSITNEIQDLQLLGNILTITNNGTATSIDLSAYLDNTDTQLNEAQVDAFVANNGYITSPDDADNDPTNEIELPASGNTNDVLTWDGAAWVAQASASDADWTIDGSGNMSNANIGEVSIGVDATVNGVTVGKGGGNIGSNTVNGYQALYSNTTGYNNIANGYDALHFNTTGYNNTANGTSALYFNTTGDKNTANGVSTLYLNESGNSNTANGEQALYKNTEGSYNTANGKDALYNNSAGYSNVAVGVRALYSNTDISNLVAIGDSALFNNGVGATFISHAIKNTAVGSKALLNNTTGAYNTANGNQALYFNTTGGYNTASGHIALYNNTTGSQNTAIGVQALYLNTEGGLNTANGYRALYSNTTGGYNTASGVNALYFNTEGHANTASGSNALHSNTTGSNNTANGYNALNYNTSGQHNTATGSQALRNNTTGAANTANGRNALYWSTGNGNIGLGYLAAANLTAGDNNIIIGYNIDAPIATGSNQLNIGNLIYGTGVDGTGSTVSSGNVGIGTASPNAKLAVHANTTTYSDAISVYNTDGTNSTETYIGKVGVSSNNVWVQGVYGEAKLTSAIDLFDGGFGVFGVVKHPTNGTVNLNASGTSAGISVNKAIGVGGAIGTQSDYIGGPQDMIASIYGGTGLHNSGNGSVSGGAKLYAGLFQGNGRTLGLWGENSTYMEFMPRWQVRDYDAGVIGFYNSDPDGGNNDADAGTGDDYLSIEANVTDATVKHVVLQTRTNGNVGIGTPSPTAKLDVNGTARVRSIPSGTSSDNYIVADASGNIKTAPIVVNVTDGGANLRMYTGHTPSTGTGWVQYNTEGIYIDVNISACGFTSAPQIYTTLEGSASHYQSKGVTSIYSKTATGFRVYVNLTGITIAEANSWNWHVSWFAIGN